MTGEGKKDALLAKIQELDDYLQALTKDRDRRVKEIEELQSKIHNFEDEEHEYITRIGQLECENFDLETKFKNPQVTDIMDWFASSHTFEYDKRLILEQFKHLL